VNQAYKSIGLPLLKKNDIEQPTKHNFHLLDIARHTASS